MVTSASSWGNRHIQREVPVKVLTGHSSGSEVAGSGDNIIRRLLTTFILRQKNTASTSSNQKGQKLTFASLNPRDHHTTDSSLIFNHNPPYQSSVHQDANTSSREHTHLGKHRQMDIKHNRIPILRRPRHLLLNPFLRRPSLLFLRNTKRRKVLQQAYEKVRRFVIRKL